MTLRPNPSLPCSNCWPFIWRPGRLRADRRAGEPAGEPDRVPAAGAAKQRHPKRSGKSQRDAPVPRSETTVAPEAAIRLGAERRAPRRHWGIASAIGKFRRLRAQNTPRPWLVFADAIRRRASCSSARPRTRRGHRGPALRWPFRQTAGRMIAAIGSIAARPNRQRDSWRPPGNRTPTRRRRKSVCRSFNGRSSWSSGRAGDARQSLDADAAVDPRGIMRTRGNGSTTTPAPARSAPSPPSIPPICCAHRLQADVVARICARSPRRWSRRLRKVGKA